MAENGEEETDEQIVDFIPAWDDAQLRLECYRSVSYASSELSQNERLAAAKALYAWTMGDYDESEEQAEPGSTATEDKCSRKH